MADFLLAKCSTKVLLFFMWKRRVHAVVAFSYWSLTIGCSGRSLIIFLDSLFKEVNILKNIAVLTAVGNAWSICTLITNLTTCLMEEL
ncbi:hypothetical protein T4C_10455 [Trichinella pseudospiralis]|uniref:Uncharacterized protein n=1 Tax=Trichinella pseudospiralis TaxID=6337 RepID=A0A0V1JCP4_TRIPS|nr:hypothetical protein T4C_10455 [Trichinella pseudospiralis]